MTEKNLKDEAVGFLERDFIQCFMQLRHYDSQIWQMCRFVYISYVAIFGIMSGLYQYATEEKKDLTIVFTAVLCVSFCFGILFYWLVIQHRAYFVKMCHYVNEHRDFFLGEMPLDFKNRSKMYTNYLSPPYFHWNSSHLILSYVIAFLNSMLIFGGVYYLTSFPLIIVSILCILVLSTHLVFSVVYFRTQA